MESFAGENVRSGLRVTASFVRRGFGGALAIVFARMVHLDQDSEEIGWGRIRHAGRAETTKGRCVTVDR